MASVSPTIAPTACPAECDGGTCDETGCTSCAEGLIARFGSCISKFGCQNLKVSTPKSLKDRSCECADTTCKSCVQTSEGETCKKCFSGFLLDGACVDSCPVDYKEV